jgi:hypothetical protein
MPDAVSATSTEFALRRSWPSLLALREPRHSRPLSRALEELKQSTRRHFANEEPSAWDVRAYRIVYAAKDVGWLQLSVHDYPNARNTAERIRTIKGSVAYLIRAANPSHSDDAPTLAPRPLITLILSGERF